MNVRYSLIISWPDGTRRELDVGEMPITIGRLPSTTLQVEESPVSRQHCVVIPTGGGLTILDQGSTNGTFINGFRRQHALLQHGDEIKVGSTTIVVNANAHPSDQPDAPPKTPDPPTASCPMLPEQQVGFFISLSERLARSRDASAIVQLVLKTVIDTLPVQRCLMLAWRSSGHPGQIRVISSKSVPSVSLPQDLFNRALVRNVIENATSQSMKAQIDTNEERPDEGATRLWDSALCAPIWKGDRAIGALYADTDSPTTWFEGHELLNLFVGVANLASTALATHQQLRLASNDEDASMSAWSRETDISDAERPLDPVLEKIKLAERLAQMEHLERARGALSRGLVHDIKNLVGALNSNHVFVRETLKEDTDEMEAMDDAVAITKRIVAMAEDVLSLSRMEEGSFPLATQVVDVLHMVTRAHRRHTVSAREHGVSVAMGPVDEGLAALIDPNVVDRMLDNLINNAIRHAGRDGWVVLTAEGNEDYAEITVSDSGPGIPETERDQVFGEFYCNDQVSSRHHGIGLYFCSVAAKAHGGEVRIEGSPGDNRLIISLPAATELTELSTTEIISRPHRATKPTS